VTQGDLGRVRDVTTRVQRLLLAFLVLVYFVLAWQGRDPVQLGSGDDVIYLALSHSVESGSYREIYRAGAPLHVKYPPAYPVWLIPVRHATGEHLDLILATNLVLVAASLVMLFVAVSSIAGGWLALVLVLLLVFNPALLWMGGSLYSEALFLFLSTAALVAARRADGSGQRTAYAVIVLALLAFLTRLAGIALVVALAPWLWSRRRRAELIAYGVASILVVGGWFGYTTMVSPGQAGMSYATDFGGAAPRVHVGAARQIVARVIQNGRSYATEGLPSSLALPSIEGTLIDNWIWLVTTIVLLTTGLLVLWRTWRVAAAYLVLYAGLLLIWPWPIERLLDPLIPFVMLAFLLGAWRLAQRLPARARTPTFAALVVLLMLGAAKGAMARVAGYRGCDRSDPSASAGCYDPETQSKIAASAYIRQHAAPGAVVLSNRPATVYFLTGHPGEPDLTISDAPAGIAARVLRDRNIPYVLLTARHPNEKGPLARGLFNSCQELVVEARFAPHALLLSTAAPTGTTDNACAALAQYMRDNPDDRRPAGQ
jgi:Gpi18-like mannosyltransferase